MKRISNIIRRELYLWSKRPIYLLGSVGVMLASAIFFLSFFYVALSRYDCKLYRCLIRGNNNFSCAANRNRPHLVNVFL